MANLIPQIAEMLGVELGEEFKVVSKDGSERACRITYAGLLVSGSSYSKRLLMDIVCGEAEIIKLPWKPKEGDTFCSFDIRYGKWVVCSYMWVRVPCDYALLDKGWIYRTKEAAQAALPDVAKELDVEYEL